MMRPAGAGTINSPGSPNWLFRGLVILSIGVHALVLAHWVGLPKTDPANFIELEMRPAERPVKRSIPSPPPRPKTEPRLTARADKSLSPVPVVRPKTPPPAMEPAVTRPSLIEPISAPPQPNVSPSAPLDWQPVAKKETTTTAPERASSANESSANYFGVVRRMIEQHKKYPYVARKRRFQGRVVVKFVILADGSVTDVALVGPSSHRMLNEAALAAVKAAQPFPKPPRQLFKGPIPLEIGVIFKLI